MRVELGSANGAYRVLGEPRVSAMDMKAVVATGNQSCQLFGFDVVEADGAFSAQYEFFTGDSWKLLQLEGREALVSDGLDRLHVINGLGAGSGVPKKAHVDDENRAHAKARQEKCQENRIKHIWTFSLEPLSDSKGKLINAVVVVGRGVPKELGIHANYPACLKFHTGLCLVTRNPPNYKK